MRPLRPPTDVRQGVSAHKPRAVPAKPRPPDPGGGDNAHGTRLAGVGANSRERRADEASAHIPPTRARGRWSERTLRSPGGRGTKSALTDLGPGPSSWSALTSGPRSGRGRVSRNRREPCSRVLRYFRPIWVLCHRAGSHRHPGVHVGPPYLCRVPSTPCQPPTWGCLGPPISLPLCCIYITHTTATEALTYIWRYIHTPRARVVRGFWPRGTAIATRARRTLARGVSRCTLFSRTRTAICSSLENWGIWGCNMIQIHHEPRPTRAQTLQS